MKAETATEIKRIYHGMTNTVASLDSIGCPITDNHYFIHNVIDLFDSRTRREWEACISGTKEPTRYATVKDFLERRVQALKALNPSKPESTPPTSASKSRGTTSQSVRSLHAQGKGKQSTKCVVCQGDHYVGTCDTFRAKKVSERRAFIQKHDLCLNCFGKHTLASCPSKKSCLVCQDRHHTTLHDVPVKLTSSDDKVVATTTHLVHHERPTRTATLLATARVLVVDVFGTSHRARALIDPGSEVSLVSETLVQRLRLPRSTSNIAVYGVGDRRSSSIRGRVNLHLTSTHDGSPIATTALVLPRLTRYGKRISVSKNDWSLLSDLQLADPEFRDNDPVDILLGVDVYPAIMRQGHRTNPGNTLVAQQTTLGWIVSGIVSSRMADAPVSSHQCTVDTALTTLVRQFWEQEEPTTAPTPLTEAEQRCEEHYRNTHSRDASGRYVVRLPVTVTLPDMSGTRHAATRLLDAMERKFNANTEFRHLYQDFMLEYEQLQHMTPVADEASKANVCYLPHHGVMKESSSTTKLRVVFNGSQQLRSGESLNSHLLVGPNLLPSLADILLRWRRHKFALAADIEKMYRQILVHPHDRDLQRIVWRYKKEDVIGDFRLNTVTYGLACAPFLAVRTLQQLAEDDGERFPKGAEALRHDSYVDDILTGADTKDEALELQSQLIDLCMAGGFPLRKWAANSDSLLRDIPLEHRMQRDPRSWCMATQPTLGIQWHPREDCFSFTARSGHTGAVTKRIVLSETARLFDPLGWLAPIIVRAKILLQSTWLQHLDWDTPLDKADAQLWQQFRDELSSLTELRIPRWINTAGSPMSLELHGFADASERAYAAVVYARVTIQEVIQVTLLQAKTKVAPVKQVSLPRLELCATALLTRLAAHLQRVLTIEPTAVTLWSDSTVTLSWIRGHPSRWKTYVANRVSEIQRTLPDATWWHIPGEHNPADCASRGLSPAELPGHTLWWHGPAWLSLERTSWPTGKSPTLSEIPEERRAAHIATAVAPEESPILLRFSQLHRLLQVTAWCRRWLKNAQRSSLLLQQLELSEAEIIWARAAQGAFYKSEIDALQKHGTAPTRGRLSALCPILDELGLLRVGGRLKHARLSYDERHPIILPPESHFTRLVVDAYHKKTLHGGVQLTLSLIRQRYWIPRRRSGVKGRIQRCVTCVRWRAASSQPIMGNLPKPRITPSRPF